MYLNIHAFKFSNKFMDKLQNIFIKSQFIDDIDIPACIFNEVLYGILRKFLLRNSLLAKSRNVAGNFRATVILNFFQ